MNILFVDDQPSVLASILSGTDWRALGFSNVYTAVNVSAAKEIFHRQSIDILVTDIEMPGEDGLSLVSWIRTNHYHTECIVLTSHADFFYAKSAIDLGIIDYVVQPARSEDITRAVLRARTKIETESARAESLKISTLTQDAQNNSLLYRKSAFRCWRIFFRNTRTTSFSRSFLSRFRNGTVFLLPETNYYRVTLLLLGKYFLMGVAGCSLGSPAANPFTRFCSSRRRKTCLVFCSACMTISFRQWDAKPVPSIFTAAFLICTTVLLPCQMQKNLPLAQPGSVRPNQSRTQIHSPGITRCIFSRSELLSIPIWTNP